MESELSECERQEETLPVPESMYLAEIEGILQRVIFSQENPNKKGYLVDRFDRGGTCFQVSVLYSLPAKYNTTPKYCTSVGTCDEQLVKKPYLERFKSMLLSGVSISIIIVKHISLTPQAFFLSRNSYCDALEVYGIYQGEY